MTIAHWVIDLEPAGYGERAKMFLDGECLGISRQPIYAAARILLKRGVNPFDTAETRRNGMTCLTGVIGGLATRTVSEGDRTPLKVTRFIPDRRFLLLHGAQE